AHLGVEREGADVDVARADDGDVVVDAQMLGVQEVRAVNVELHAGFQQLVVIGLLGEVGDELVRVRGQDQVDLDAAKHGGLHRLKEGLIGNEVGRGDDDALLRGVDQVDHQRLRVFAPVAGAAGEKLCHRRADGDGRRLRKQL